MKGGDFWVYASDIGWTPGDFVWADNRTVDSLWWDKISGDPSDYGYGKNTCVYLNSKQKALCDHSCLYGTYSLCQLPEQLARCF
jgi:hypothetical protein